MTSAWAAAYCSSSHRVRGFDRQLASLRHGVASVDGEIDDRVFKLVRVGFDPPKSGRRNDLELHVSPSARLSRSDMPATSLSTSRGFGAKGWRREKASSR
jgi:hypothetical protein